MRTNIVLDDELMREALKLTGLKTKKAVVHRALRDLVAAERRRRLLRLKGKLEWSGDLASMRDARDDPR